MMVTFEPPRFIALAIVIWAVWRIIIWRRQGADVVREAVVLALFLWSLLVFYFTFFPMGIVLYSWYGSYNFVPFASITQLIRDTSVGLASYNIIGNLLLLAPLGILLPLLFKRLQRLWPLVWRVGAISALIEASQLICRVPAGTQWFSISVNSPKAISSRRPTSNDATPDPSQARLRWSAPVGLIAAGAFSPTITWVRHRVARRRRNGW